MGFAGSGPPIKIALRLASRKVPVASSRTCPRAPLWGAWVRCSSSMVSW
jgi:hypothetical protein